jgi:hypothetical protein
LIKEAGLFSFRLCRHNKRVIVERERKKGCCK